MEKIKELKESLTAKFTGQKYHNNLLGESLHDLLRKATSKTLFLPDEEINQQVVETIEQEVANGRDTKDIATLLKKRLRTDNPQKQWLGIIVLGKVMRECSNVLGLHQDDLLQEVARVMAHPAKPETEAGKKTRQAAKDLLRSYGRAAASAFRAVRQENRGQLALHGGMAAGYGAPPPGGYPAGYPPAGYPQGAGGQGGDRLSLEKQSVIAEVNMLIDQARANTELLSDMLVNASEQQDEFGKELTSELVQEVRELRDLFTAYLDQMQQMDGAEIEALMIRALEAADMLDGAIALQQDVAANQREAVAAPGTSSAAAPAAAAAAVAAAPPPPSGDLIALDDLAEAMSAAPSAAAPGPAAAAAAPATSAFPVTFDPFAASPAIAPAYIIPAAANAAPAPQQQQPPPYAQPAYAQPAYAQPPPQQPQQSPSAFATAFAQPGGQQTYQALANAAPPAAPPPAAPGAYPAMNLGAPPQQQQAYPPPQQSFGVGSPPGAGGFGAPPPAAPTQQQYLYGVPSLGASASNPFASSLPPAAMPAPALSSHLSANNPFAAAAGPPPAPAYGQQQQYAAPQAYGQPPAAAPVPAPDGAAKPAVDHEWDMFFAGRAATGQAPTDIHRLNADFDALMAKPVK